MSLSALGLNPGIGPSRRRRAGILDRHQPLGHDLFNGLVDWWPLAEQSDVRSGLHAGTRLTDGNTVTGADGVASYDRAARFTSANSEYLSRADEAALQVGDMDFMICGWVYLNTTTGDPALISRYELNNDRSFLLFYNSSAQRFRFNVTSDGTSGTIAIVNADAFGIPTTGSWNFVVAWHSASANSINIQVNNGTVNSTSHSAGVFAGTAPFMLGTRPSSGTPGDFLNGRMQSVGFWKRVLTADERTALYNGGRAVEYADVPKTDLVDWWPLREDDGNRAGMHAGLTLTDNNTVTSEVGVGKPGNSLASQFTSANSEGLSCPSTTNLDAGAVHTLCAWVYLDTAGANRPIVSKYDTAPGTGPSWLLFYDSGLDRFRYITVNAGNLTEVVFGSAPSTRRWHWVVAGRDGTNNFISMDNAALVTAAGNVPGANTVPFQVGTFHTSGVPAAFMNGRIQRLGFWKRALTSDERTHLYNSGRGRDYPFV